MILKKKNILITGAGKGIGLATVEKAVKEGAFVYAITRSKNDIKNLKKIGNLKVYFGNTSNLKLINKIFKDSINDKKTITGLVNNAGIRQRINFEKISRKQIKEVFENNFFSTFYIMQIFVKHLMKKKLKGSIVNLGSIVGPQGFKDLTGYAATKSAIAGLTKSFAAEMASKNIRANIINPGFTKSSFYKKFKKKKTLYKWTLSRIPQRRWGEPNEIANLICFLISDNSSYITGEDINIDGGWSNS